MWNTALPIDTVTLEYSENGGVNCGLTITVPRKEYDDDRQRLMCDSGNVISIKMNPLEGNITMADVLKTEQAHRMGMPIGNTQAYLKTLEAKLFAIRGEPLENMLQLVPSQNQESSAPTEPVSHQAEETHPSAKPSSPSAKPISPTKQTKPLTFDEVIKQAQAKADDINRKNALNKGQQPATDKTKPEIGD